jgi:hypothetical protein
MTLVRHFRTSFWPPIPPVLHCRIDVIRDTTAPGYPRGRNGNYDTETRRHRRI